MAMNHDMMFRKFKEYVLTHETLYGMRLKYGGIIV